MRTRPRTQAPGLVPALALLTALIGAASGAGALDYSLVGEVHDQQGSIELPVASTLFAVPPGLTAMGTAMQTGPVLPGRGPATITFPPRIVSDIPMSYMGFLIPVPSVIQLTTMFAHYGPTATTTVMANRTGPTNFAFCPGATANPSCSTAAAGGSQGTLGGIIKYTAGPNKFGGTLKMLLSGTGTLTNKGDALPPTVMTPMGATHTALPFSAINILVAGGDAPSPTGRGFLAGVTYGDMVHIYEEPLPRSHPYGYRSTPKGLLSRGPTIGLGPAYYGTGTNFPITTGQVYAYRKAGAQASSAPVPSKITATGYDKRTAGGNGRIFLVAGNLARTYPTDGSNPPEGSNLAVMHYMLTFTRQPAVPLSSPAMLMTLGMLVMLTAGYAVARREG